MLRIENSTKLVQNAKRKKELLAYESDTMCISKYRPSRHLSVAYLTAVDETVSYCRTLYSILSLTLSQWSDWSIGVM